MESAPTPSAPKPDGIIQKFTSNFREFNRTGALSGILLLIVAVVAMVWANSGWAHFYFEIWSAPLEISLSSFKLDKPLLFWVNDGLMGLFFFYVGLEIKREIKVGELSEPGQAILPLMAAAGGIILPASIFLILSYGKPGAEGWGVPMATDIAFSLGLLMLLGKRVPNSLKVFLIAFAIFDDLAAVALIAIYYSHGIQFTHLALAGGVYAMMWAFNFLNVRNGLAYFLAATVMWYFFLKGGIHPTVAGILAAVSIPANTNLHMKHFVERTKSALDEFWDEKSSEIKNFLTREQLDAIDEMDDNIEKVQPPLQRLEDSMSASVNYLIMPVFALANAGVSLQAQGENDAIGSLTWYVFFSLLIGKVVGITFFTWLGVKLKMAALPSQTTWTNMIGIGFLGGVGFTMALFIAGLAFDDPARLSQAKIGILLGSFLAGTIGLIVLRLSLKKPVLENLYRI